MASVVLDHVAKLAVKSGYGSFFCLTALSTAMSEQRTTRMKVRSLIGLAVLALVATTTMPMNAKPAVIADGVGTGWDWTRVHGFVNPMTVLSTRSVKFGAADCSVGGVNMAWNICPVSASG